MTMTKFSRINKQREEITMRVLEDMEKGGNEWKKPWVEASPLPPHNPISGTQYSGRNFLYTYVYGMMRGYADPRWATEKQIKEMGWKIPENLQNGRGGINDELGVGIEHWGMYAYIPRVKKDGTPLAAKVIPYAENKAQPAPDRSLGHKHEVNRDAAQRMQASRENAVSMIGDHAIHM